jgi:hypothetical protein
MRPFIATALTVSTVMTPFAHSVPVTTQKSSARRRELLGNRFYCCVLVAQHKKSFENT